MHLILILLLILFIHNISVHTHIIYSSISPKTPVPVTLVIQTVAKKFSITVKPNATVGDVKSEIESKEGIQVQQQRLLFNGRQLQDKYALDDYFISIGATLILVLRLSEINGGQTVQLFSALKIPLLFCLL